MADPARPFRHIAPVLQVADVRAALDYYRRVLGFEEGFVWGDPPQYGMVGRDHQAEVHFTLKTPVRDHSILYISVPDADAYHAEVAARGAKVLNPPADQPYRMREFAVEDPDGHRLFIGSRLEDKSGPLLPPAK